MVGQTKQKGFTIVELLIVIVVIAILAAITVVAYNGITKRANESAMASALKNAATAFELYKVDNDAYPTSIPTSVNPPAGVVLSMTVAAAGTFCLNAYHQSGLTSSFSSTNGQQSGLCSGAAIGGEVGGSVPTAPRGTNVMPGFSQWTLSGGATYNSGTGELTLGVTGSALSPMVRIDKPASMVSGGSLYATQVSPSSSLPGQAGWHNGSTYFGADGVTSVLNSAGWFGNGCARGFSLSTWATGTCSYSGGSNVVYVKIVLYGSNGGYSSPDLKIKNPTLILN